MHFNLPDHRSIHWGSKTSIIMTEHQRDISFHYYRIRMILRFFTDITAPF